MYSKLCIVSDCDEYHSLDNSNILILYRCDSCKAKKCFVLDDELKYMTAIKALENKHAINFKKYEKIKLENYPELDKYITNLMKHPKFTLLKQAFCGSPIVNIY